MEKNKIVELQNKIIEGLNKTATQLLETKKKNNGKLAFCVDGKIKIIDASQLQV